MEYYGLVKVYFNDVRCGIGSGPNGLAADIVLAQASISVLILEANEALGGGARSAELMLPSVVLDFCSAVHPNRTRREKCENQFCSVLF
ncbi:MAG: NAD(P)-binding protein [Pyrinomonadaceae bacterium]|nr:NAD(P)-binding protein [Pyrinomonadaceae bacterium]